ncbi:hypothetical protein [Pseudonocardia sp. DLS-67]
MSATGAPSALLSAMADAMMDSPAGIARLLAVHVDDGTGHCRGCPLGAQRGYSSGTCILRAAATLAIERRQGPGSAHTMAPGQRDHGVARPTAGTGAGPQWLGRLDAQEDITP